MSTPTTDPVRDAHRSLIEGLLPQIPDWLPHGPAESWGDEDGVGHELRKETSAANLRWMLTQCLENLDAWPIDKVSRWCGFVQGVLACKSPAFSVKAERDRTRPFFHAAYIATGQTVPTTQEYDIDTLVDAVQTRFPKMLATLRAAEIEQSAEAKKLYIASIDDSAIHSNRFPAWEELTAEAQAEWVAKVKETP